MKGTGKKPGSQGTIESRQRFLDFSHALLEAEGVEALSLREVARRAGLTHQAPYHYFANKEALLAELVASGFDELTKRLAAALDGSRRSSRRTMVACAGRAYVHFALERPQVFRLMFRKPLVDTRRFPETAAAGDRAYAELRRMIELAHPGKNVDDYAGVHWAFVHGLASLVLDGNLVEHAGSLAMASRKSYADKLVRMFAQLVGSAPPKTSGGLPSHRSAQCPLGSGVQGGRG